MNVNEKVPLVSTAQLAKWSDETWSSQWNSSRTFFESLQNDINVPKLEKYISSLRIHNDYEELKNRKITGAISEGWKDLNVSGPLFQESLWSVMQTYPSNWTPVDYLMEYARNCKLNFPRQQKYDLGRALRNLPSFLREYLIHSLLIERGINVTVPSPLDNAKDHADLYLMTENGRVGIWSFQSTHKGFAMLHRKVRFRATNFTDLNFICPFRTSVDAVKFHDWFIPSDKYIDSIIKFTQEIRLSSARDFESWILSAGEGSQYVMVTAAELKKLMIT